jgi:hypothetical protein
MKAKYKHYGNECIIYDAVYCDDNVVTTVRSYICGWSNAQPETTVKVYPTNSEARRMFFNICKKFEKERYDCEYKEDFL